MTAVAFVLKGYPRLSETFIAQEIHALEARGLDIRIVSLRHPTDLAVHPIHREIAAPVLYLPEYLYQEPVRVLRAFWRRRRLPAIRRVLAAWWHDLRRDPTPNRVRRLGQAFVLADELPDDVGALHAHFLHTPASVTRYAAMLRGLPWSVSAHAKDIWTIPAWEKSEKLADCRWAVTCTGANADHLRDLAPDPGRVRLVYHGLDVSRFAAPARDRAARDGHDPDDPVTILVVGRAVEKKGIDILLRALAALPPALHWRLVHVGGGPLKKRLAALAGNLGIAERVTFAGSLPQEAVIGHYRAADLFVLPSRITADGDRDGLPNVLMEAQSQGLACLSTTVSAIPEIIEDGVNGLLVPPESPDALSHALRRLIADPVLRHRLGAAGRRRVGEQFGHQACIAPLAALFGLAQPEAAPAVRADACESLSTHP